MSKRVLSKNGATVAENDVTEFEACFCFWYETHAEYKKQKVLQKYNFIVNYISLTTKHL